MEPARSRPTRLTVELQLSTSERLSAWNRSLSLPPGNCTWKTNARSMLTIDAEAPVSRDTIIHCLSCQISSA